LHCCSGRLRAQSLALPCPGTASAQLCASELWHCPCTVKHCWPMALPLHSQALLAYGTAPAQSSTAGLWHCLCTVMHLRAIVHVRSRCSPAHALDQPNVMHSTFDSHKKRIHLASNIPLSVAGRAKWVSAPAEAQMSICQIFKALSLRVCMRLHLLA